METKKEESILLEYIRPNWGGDYRLEYDGKYVTLFGKDKNYAMPRYGGEEGETYYEEMVLVPVLYEGRGLEPEIVDVNDKYIKVRLWK